MPWKVYRTKTIEELKGMIIAKLDEKDGLSYEELASELGTTPGAVRLACGALVSEGKIKQIEA